MKFRKKHKNESEVFTDSLNDILFILLMFFLIVATIANPNIKKVNNPHGKKDTKAKQDIVVSIDKDQNFYVAQRKVNAADLDTVLSQEIDRVRRTRVDTPTVVINADSLTFYGAVMRVNEIGALKKVKVVAKVQ